MANRQVVFIALLIVGLLWGKGTTATTSWESQQQLPMTLQYSKAQLWRTTSSCPKYTCKPSSPTDSSSCPTTEGSVASMSCSTPAATGGIHTCSYNHHCTLYSKSKFFANGSYDSYDVTFVICGLCMREENTWFIYRCNNTHMTKFSDCHSGCTRCKTVVAKMSLPFLSRSSSGSGDTYRVEDHSYSSFGTCQMYKRRANCSLHSGIEPYFAYVPTGGHCLELSTDNHRAARCTNFVSIANDSRVILTKCAPLAKPLPDGTPRGQCSTLLHKNCTSFPNTFTPNDCISGSFLRTPSGSTPSMKLTCKKSWCVAVYNQTAAKFVRSVVCNVCQETSPGKFSIHWCNKTGDGQLINSGCNAGCGTCSKSHPVTAPGSPPGSLSEMHCSMPSLCNVIVQKKFFDDANCGSSSSGGSSGSGSPAVSYWKESECDETVGGGSLLKACHATHDVMLPLLEFPSQTATFTTSVTPHSTTSGSRTLSAGHSTTSRSHSRSLSNVPTPEPETPVPPTPEPETPVPPTPEPETPVPPTPEPETPNPQPAVPDAATHTPTVEVETDAPSTQSPITTNAATTVTQTLKIDTTAEPPSTESPPVVVGTFKIQGNRTKYAALLEGNFETAKQLVTDLLAKLLDIDASFIEIRRLFLGSLGVEFKTVAPTLQDTTALATQLKRGATNATSSDFASLAAAAGIENISSVSVDVGTIVVEERQEEGDGINLTNVTGRSGADTLGPSLMILLVAFLVMLEEVLL